MSGVAHKHYKLQGEDLFILYILGPDALTITSNEVCTRINMYGTNGLHRENIFAMHIAFIAMVYRPAGF